MTSLRQSASSLLFDDSAANLDPGSIQIAIQAAIENLDLRQDQDDLSNFRSENVLSVITSLSPAPANGWHLFGGAGANQNKLLLIDNGAVVDEYVPKADDTIIVQGTRKDFDGNSWNDFQGGSRYWLDKVTAALDSLPTLGSQGDRFLLKTTPPAIKVWDVADSAFVDEPFLDGAKVGDGLVTWIRRGDELDCENQIIKRDRDPNFCDNFPLGFEWQNTNTDELWKLVDKGSFGTSSETIGQVLLNQGSNDAIPVEDNSEVWQSFTPAVDGTLQSFQLSGTYGAGFEHNFVFKLYEGSGIGGSLVFEEQITEVSFAGVATPVFIFECPYPVNAGKQYTYSLQRVAGSDQFSVFVYRNLAAESVKNFLPNETSSDGVKDLVNRIIIQPGTGNIWVKIKDLINTESAPENISVIEYKVKAIASAITTTGHDLEDKFLLTSDHATNPNAIATLVETSPGVYGFDYTPLVDGDSVLIGATSSTQANYVADFAQNSLTFRSPDEVEAIITLDNLATCVWRNGEWTAINVARIKATSDLTFYIDDVNGDDQDSGSALKPFRTSQGAIAKVASQYDFCWQYAPTFKDLSVAKSSATINIPTFLNVPSDKQVAYQGRDDGTTVITGTQNSLFTINVGNSQTINFSKLTCNGTGTGINRSFFFLSSGQTILSGITFTGFCRDPISGLGASLGRVESDGLFFDNFSGRRVFSIAQKCRIRLDAKITARGANTFTITPIQTNGHSELNASSATTFDLDTGATVTSPYAAILNQQCYLYLTNRKASEVIWGLNKVRVNGGTYNASFLSKNHSYWRDGLVPAINGGDSTKLDISAGEYVIFDDSDRATPFWLVVDQPDTQLDFPGLLATNNEVYLYADENGYQIDLSEPTIANLGDRFCFSLLQTSDNTNLSQIYRILVERSPASLPLLELGGIKNDAIIPARIPSTKEIEVNGGFLEVVGANYFVDANDLHAEAITAGTITFDIFDPSGSIVLANQSDIEFENYWDGTAVQVLPDNNDATWQFLYYCPYKQGNKWAFIIGKYLHTTFANARNNFYREQHVKPDFLGQCILVGRFFGRKDYGDSANDNTNINRIGIFSNLFSERSGGNGVNATDGVLLGVAPADISTISAAVYHEFRTTDGRIFKTFDNISWEEQ